MSPSRFSSLHEDIAWNILARVLKRLYPILACVSKNLRSLVRSPEIHRIRSLLRKDSVYICFMHILEGVLRDTRHWFTLRRTENNPSEENQFVSVDLEFPDHGKQIPSIIACGPEIFFISGCIVPSSTVWVFDSRTGEFRRGPSMDTRRYFKTVGLVGSKIYVVGGDEISEADAFDVKTQTWAPAPNHDEERSFLASANVSLDKKVCGLYSLGYTLCYDTRDGSCSFFNLPEDEWWGNGVCVMDNVLYVYYARFGLMWYDTELELWRVVSGLDDMKKVRYVAMAEYYGKMAFLWKDCAFVGCEMKEVWCRMIAFERSEGEIKGTAESAQLMGSVPRGYIKGTEQNDAVSGSKKMKEKMGLEPAKPNPKASPRASDSPAQVFGSKAVKDKTEMTQGCRKSNEVKTYNKFSALDSLKDQDLSSC